MPEQSGSSSSSAGSLNKIAPLLKISRRFKKLPIPRPLARWIRQRMVNSAPEDLVTDVFDFKMRLRPRDQVDSSLLTVPQMYDAQEIAFIKQRLQPGDTFLDIGSHIGFYSLIMAKIVGTGGKVVAIEATPKTFERLKENVALNNLTQVHCFNVGVSDKEETLHLAFRDSENTGGNSFMFPGEEGIKVPCRPLLDVLREAGVTSVAAAKMDIEGFEFRVLSRFFADADRALLPRTLVIELNYFHFPEESKNALALLEANGYRSEAVTDLNHMMVLSPR